MPRPDSPRRILPPLFDRLSAGAEASSPTLGIEELRDSVRRELEDLLNTHRSDPPLPPGFVELTDSIFTYGMPDPSALSTLALQGGDEISRMMAAQVSRFEPRLGDVTVRMTQGPDSRARSIRFHVEARLHVEPFSDVAFETLLELATGHASIREDQT